ncbi:hypothetical protein BH09MYX1_BH09MYX1_43770 [soil metagenome]
MSHSLRSAAVLFSSVLGAALLAHCSSDPDPVVTDAGSDAASDVVADTPVDVTVDAPLDAGPCATDASDELPLLLSCAGLYADIAKKTVAPGLVSYQPGIQFWSDGAVKERWLYLPPNQTIDVSDLDDWKFPVGTKAWKEFKVNGKRIETRVFWKRGPTDWTWATYVWAADESEATKNDDGAKNVVGTYEIPDKNTCDQCHNGRKDKLLGLEAIALAIPTAQGITLDSLAKAGRLAPTPSKTTATLPEDSTGKAGAALGHLHMNCGVTCHNHYGGAGAALSGLYMKLPAALVLAGTATVTSLETYTTSANQTIGAANFVTFKNAGYTRLTPGMSGKSLIPALIGMRGAFQMPPIVTHEPDTAGELLVKGWIDAL